MFYKVTFIFWNMSVAGVSCGCVKHNPRGSRAAACISKVSRVCSQIHPGITVHTNEMCSAGVWTSASLRIINSKI